MASSKKASSKPAGKFKVQAGPSGKMNKFGGAVPQQPGVSATTKGSGKGGEFAKAGPSGKMHGFAGGQKGAEGWPHEPELMARAPRSKVPKTTGQGISRLSYQKGRELGGNISLGSSGGKTDTRSYEKKVDPIATPPINISYGDTYEPTDLADVKALGQRQPSGKAGATLAPKGNKKWLK